MIIFQPGICRKCGATIVATTCPHCGADEFTAWDTGCGRSGCCYCGTIEFEGCEKGECATCKVEPSQCPMVGQDIEDAKRSDLPSEILIS